MILGLRVDVDTLMGLSRGVPRLLSLLKQLNLRATFFVPTGPDRMGRNIGRALRERKLGFPPMPYLRLYGWQMLLNGTLRTPPSFVEAGAELMLKIRVEGHEVGIHSFDHFGWQKGIERYSRTDLERDFERCITSFIRVFGELPLCSAAPGWKATGLSLLAQERYGFRYASDTRGSFPFFPRVSGRRLHTLQIPVSLPTLDELALQGKRVLNLPKCGTHVYCAHADFEGLRGLNWFRSLLEGALRNGATIVPLSTLARASSTAPEGSVRSGNLPGRTSAVALQVSA